MLVALAEMDQIQLFLQLLPTVAAGVALVVTITLAVLRVALVAAVQGTDFSLNRVVLVIRQLQIHLKETMVEQRHNSSNLMAVAAAVVVVQGVPVATLVGIQMEILALTAEMD